MELRREVEVKERENPDVVMLHVATCTTETPTPYLEIKPPAEPLAAFSNQWGNCVALTLSHHGKTCDLLLDTCGGQSSYASENWVATYSELHPCESTSYQIQGVFGETLIWNQQVFMSIRLGSFKRLVYSKMAPLQRCDLILGLDFLDYFVTSICPDHIQLWDEKKKHHVFLPLKPQEPPIKK